MTTEQHKKFRRDFYRDTLLAEYQDVRFCGNIVVHLNEAKNHFDFNVRKSFHFAGHINWYWQKSKIQEFGGNAIVVISLQDNQNIDDWSIKPTEWREARREFLFSTNVEESDAGVEQAVAWAASVFQEVKTRLSKNQSDH